MDLRRLSHFLAVVDHGGFTAAAREVDVSQPALSLSVKELEAELGTALFHRLGRRVVLTAAGQALLGPARQALRDVATGRAAVDAVAGLRAGRLAVASLPTLAADPLADLVGRFRTAHPGVTVDLAAPEDTAGVVAMLRDGRCEVGLTEALSPTEGLVSHGLGNQALLFVLPPGTPFVGGRRRSGPPSARATDLAGIPFVAAPAGTSTRRLLEAAFPAGAGPEVAVESAQRDAIVPLVLSGAGAALVPEATAAEAAGRGAVVVRPEPPVTRAIALVHTDGPLAPAAARFVTLATEAGATGAG